MKVTFSGESREIFVLSGVTELDVQVDLYSDWKEWVRQSDNSKFLQAFRTFGGDPTITGQFAPRYYFLTNGWRVVVNNEEVVSVGTNLYTDEQESPYIVGNGSGVSDRNSDAVIVDNGVQETLDYGGKIVYDENSIYNGTSWPVGTNAQPVNNVESLKTLQNNLGISLVELRSNITLTQNINNTTLYSTFGTSVVNANGRTFDRCMIDTCILEGEFNNSVLNVRNCLIRDVNNVSGVAQDSYLGGRLKISAFSSMTFSHCVAHSPSSSPSIDLNVSGDTFLNLRGYSGELDVFNCNSSGTTASLEFISGRLTINSGCTDGFISVRGVATIGDILSTGTSINVQGLIDAQYSPKEPWANQHSINVLTEINKNK